MFTSEEFAYYPGEEERVERWIDYVAAVDETLEGRGIDLVVVVVPAKARLYPEQLGRYEYPDYAQDRVDRFREGVLERGVPAPDLTEVYADASGAEEYFLRTDTHWSPAGTLAAARALEPSVTAALEAKGSPRTEFVWSRRGAEEFEGDLLTFLPLGPFMERFGPEPERVRTVEVTEGESVSQDEPTGLFEEVTIPITLVGTSYSAEELWNFDGAIKSVVNADVLNVATEGEGPFIPMAEWLESDAIEETPPDVVIWEIPERYLPVIYEVGFPGE